MSDVFDGLPADDEAIGAPAAPGADAESLIERALDLLASAKTMPLSSSRTSTCSQCASKRSWSMPAMALCSLAPASRANTS